MLNTILNPNPLMLVGYLCFLSAGIAAVAIRLWNNSTTRQQWKAQEITSRRSR